MDFYYKLNDIDLLAVPISSDMFVSINYVIPIFLLLFISSNNFVSMN